MKRFGNYSVCVPVYTVCKSAWMEENGAKIRIFNKFKNFFLEKILIKRSKNKANLINRRKQILAKMFPLTNLTGVLLSLIMLIQLAWSRLYFHPRQVTGYIRAYRAVIGNRQTNSNVVVIRRLRPCRWLSP